MRNESAEIRAAIGVYVPTQAERKYGAGHANKMAASPVVRSRAARDREFAAMLERVKGDA